MKCLIIETCSHHYRYSKILATIIEEKLNWQVESALCEDLLNKPKSQCFSGIHWLCQSRLNIFFSKSLKIFCQISARHYRQLLLRYQSLALILKYIHKKQINFRRHFLACFVFVRQFSTAYTCKVILIVVKNVSRNKLQFITWHLTHYTVCFFIFANIRSIASDNKMLIAAVQLLEYGMTLLYWVFYNLFIILCLAGFHFCNLLRENLSFVMFVSRLFFLNLLRNFGRFYSRISKDVIGTLNLLFFAPNLLRDYDLIITYELNPNPCLLGLNIASWRLLKPVVLIPDFFPNPSEQAYAFQYNLEHILPAWSSMLFGKLAKDWILFYNGKYLIRLPLHLLLSGILLYRHCKRPWIVNSGFVSKILLPSEKVKEFYIKTHFRSTALDVIGSIVDDKLFLAINDQGVRRKIFKKYDLDPARPLLVCALPPSQYTDRLQNHVQNGYEFLTYSDLVSAWLVALADKASVFNILLCLHPRSDPDELSKYLPHSIHLSQDNIEDVLPLADLYVASISTTISLALACGIPVINYDCYRYCYSDFQSSSAVEHVMNLADFEHALERVSHPMSLTVAHSIAEKESKLWGRVDGRFAARLAAVLKSIALTRADPSHYCHTHSDLGFA